MMFTVEHLLEGRPKPVSITLDKTVAAALSLMTEHDFSQLPVVDAANKPAGIITSDSILRAARHFEVLLKDLKVSSSSSSSSSL